MTIADQLRAATELITVQQTAKLLGIHYITAHRMTKSGRLPTVRVGTRVRVDPRVLAGWIDARSLQAS